MRPATQMPAIYPASTPDAGREARPPCSAAQRPLAGQLGAGDDGCRAASEDSYAVPAEDSYAVPATDFSVWFWTRACPDEQDCALLCYAVGRLRRGGRFSAQAPHEGTGDPLRRSCRSNRPWARVVRHRMGPAHICRMPPERAVLSGLSMSGGGDRTGWLGRQDSNLGMSRFDPFPISLKYRRDFAKTRPESDYRRLFRERAARRRVLHRMPKYGERNPRSFHDQLCRKPATTFARNDWLSGANRASLRRHG